jgi:membrane protein
MPASPERSPDLYRRIVAYFHAGIWRVRLRELHGLRRPAFRLFRTVYLSAREFRNDRCPQQASALTFYSLLSVVPGAAIALAIARGFGLEHNLETFVRGSFNWRPEVVDLIINSARSLIASSSTGLITGVGVVLLFWSVVSVLGSIENTFNDIREVRSPRNWPRRLGDYIIVILAGTTLLVVSSGVALLIESQLRIIGQYSIGGSLFSTVILRLLGFIATAALFTFLYLIMPNERVRVRPSIFGGLIAGGLYLVVQYVYIKLQVGVVQYAAIYGGFVAIPLFLAWVQVSWNIVLFGAELSFAYENAETFGFEPDYARLSEAVRRLLGLRIMGLLARNSAAAGQPLTADEISLRLEIPHRLVRHLLHELVATDLATVTPRGPRAYEPAGGVDALTIKFVTDKLDGYRGSEMPSSKQEDAVALSGALDEFSRAVEHLPANARLIDIGRQPHAGESEPVAGLERGGDSSA